MFRGFIVLGVAFTVGYGKGYLKGQKHTAALEELLTELRDSEATEKFITDLGNAIARLPEVKVEPEEGNTDSSNGDVKSDHITATSNEGE